MNNPTDTNQASEGDIREQTRRSIARLISIKRGDDTWSDDDYITAGNILMVFSSYIRTEKLKLLAEVRERVVGRLEHQTENGLLPDRVDRRNQLRTEQLDALTKLEAEL